MTCPSKPGKCLREKHRRFCSVRQLLRTWLGISEYHPVRPRPDEAKGPMTNATASTVVRLMCHISDNEKSTDLPDRELLERFRTKRDDDAFQALVRRHGAMVLRVCRNVLGQEQDAEDAFQLTFLVLARRCGSIRKQESLGGWLHGVAHRTALHTRRTARRRRIREREAKPTLSRDPARELSWREVQAILDEEIRRLPEWLRSPFILCILEGRRGTDVARELRLQEGTVWSPMTGWPKYSRRRVTNTSTSSAAVPATVLATLRRSSSRTLLNGCGKVTRRRKGSRRHRPATSNHRTSSD